MKMDEMVSKKQVSNLVVLVVAMVLMANYFVSCENTNIEDVESNHHDHHFDGNNVKESHDLVYHHHNGHKIMEVGGVVAPKKNAYCHGQLCSSFDQDCDPTCVCVPFLITIGVCVGSCC